MQLMASIPPTFNTRRDGRALHVAEELFRRFGVVFPSPLRPMLARPHSRLCARVIAKAAEYGYAISP